MTHASLLETHFSASFLSSFPIKLRRIDDKAGAGGSGMVEGPDLDRAVFVRCLGIPAHETSNAAVLTRGGLDDDMDQRDPPRQPRYAAVDISCGHAALSQSGGSGDDPDSTQMQAFRQHGAERIISMKRGDIWMVRWRSVQDAVAIGHCELV